MNELREKLAALEHEQWSGWMRYLFSKCNTEGDEPVSIPTVFVKRWYRQMNTPYADLTENEKDSDRAEADRVLEIMAESGPNTHLTPREPDVAEGE